MNGQRRHREMPFHIWLLYEELFDECKKLRFTLSLQEGIKSVHARERFRLRIPCQEQRGSMLASMLSISWHLCETGAKGRRDMRLVTCDLYTVRLGERAIAIRFEGHTLQCWADNRFIAHGLLTFQKVAFADKGSNIVLRQSGIPVMFTSSFPASPAQLCHSDFSRCSSCFYSVFIQCFSYRSILS